jgi:hypothetical protein
MVTIFLRYIEVVFERDQEARGKEKKEPRQVVTAQGKNVGGRK